MLIVSLSEGWCPHNYWLLSNGVILEDMELYVAPIDSACAMGQVPYKGHHVHQLCDFPVLFFLNRKLQKQRHLTFQPSK